MKRIIISLMVALSMVSCVVAPPPHFKSPEGEIGIMIFKLDNPEYYNHVLCLHNGSNDYSNLMPLYANYPNKIFVNMENGYKLVYVQDIIRYGSPIRFCKFYGFNYTSFNESFGDSPSLVIGDIAPWENIDKNNYDIIIKEINLLDSAPKYEFYVFTYNNMGDYKSRLPYWLTNRNNKGLQTEFVPSNIEASAFTKREVTDIYKVYYDVFNEIIRNGKLEKYCTLAVKDNEVIIDRPLSSVQ